MATLSISLPTFRAVVESRGSQQRYGIRCTSPYRSVKIFADYCSYRLTCRPADRNGGPEKGGGEATADLSFEKAEADYEEADD